MSINTSHLSATQNYSNELSPPVAGSNKKPIPLPPLPTLETKKEGQHSFAWPPKKVKQHLAYSVQQFKQFIDDLKEEAPDDTRQFLERFEEKLAAMKKFNKSEITQYLTWGNDFYQQELKDHSAIPLFFKNEFKQWLQLLRLTRSWNHVQKTLEAPIKKAYQQHVLDELLSQDASNQKQQLGQIFINLYQVDRPQYLQQRLQTADKLCATLVKNQQLEKKQIQALQDLLQELHGIVDPLISSSLAGRVSQSIPSSSKWERWKEFFRSIFATIQEVFRRLAWTEKSLELPDYLLTEHCDFKEELVVREEIFKQATIGDHNSYLHQITTENETFVIHRSGAISMLDSSTHLAKLKKEIMEEWEQQIQASSFGEFHALAMDHLQQHWNVHLYHALQKVEKHQSALDDQMLQLIAQQVKAHIADIVDPSRMTLPRLTRMIQLTQLSLLDPQKEYHQMLEMAALFHRFNGKEIVFEDVETPSLDGETISLPLSLLKNAKTGEAIAHPDVEEPFTLSCTFFNTFASNLKTNKEKQTTINQHALQETQKNLDMIQAFIEKHPKKRSLLKISLVELLHRFKQIEERLNQGEISLAIAQEIALIHADMHGMMGINCSDGTHRTSHLMGKLVMYFIDREINQRDDLSQKEKKALKRKLI